MATPGQAQTSIDLGALSQRVTGLESGLAGLSLRVEQSGQSLSSQISSLARTIDERGKTQWPVLIGVAGLMLAFMSSVGALAYLPIKADVLRVEEGIRTTVSMREFDAYRGNANAAIRDLRNETIPRNVAEERNRTQDQAIQNIQRQIDELGKRTGEIYSARDVIIDLKQRLDRYEMSRRASP